MPQENKELNKKGVVGKLWGIKTLNDLDIKLFEFLDKLTINEKQYGALGEEYALKLSDFIQSLLDKQRSEVIKLLSQDIGMLRQWLNEDRITDTKKMVTNEEIKVWFKNLTEIKKG